MPLDEIAAPWDFRVESLKEQIRQRAAQSPRLGYAVKFALVDDGAIRWDGTGTEPLIDTVDGPADTTIQISEENLD